mmetsp:Transcript_13369/g.53225  ORF Transcript_13369/g.53225 Transcript_13369/m.53225 type:complete len:210 (-) Transcript_13369:104-733(-)
MPEFLNKPAEENLLQWCLHFHKVPNCCFKRKFDLLSHFLRNVMNLYGHVVELMINSLAAMGMVLGNPGASPNISLLWEDPVSGAIAIALIFITPVLAFIYILVLELVMEQAENYERPVVLRVILFFVFWFLVFLTILIIAICIFLGGMAALQIVLAIWLAQLIINLCCCHPLIVCLMYVFRSLVGMERKEELPVVHWFPHVCQTEEFDD